MQKTLTFSGFIIASLFVVAIFVTATTYTQLAIAVILYPFLVYLTFRLIPRRTRKLPVVKIKFPSIGSDQKEKTVTTYTDGERLEVADINKRAFLKIIGATGISFFIFSLLNKRVGGLLSGGTTPAETVSLKNTAGLKVDPVERQPTDGYRISEIDDSIISYFGFINKDGAWFIMKEDSDSGSFRYSRGDFNFAQGWANREHLKYDYFNNVFQKN